MLKTLFQNNCFLSLLCKTKDMKSHILNSKTWTELTKNEIKSILPSAKTIKNGRRPKLGMVKVVSDVQGNEIGLIFKDSLVGSLKINLI